VCLKSRCVRLLDSFPPLLTSGVAHQGYKTDITQLRSKLKDMEQQLYKLAVHLSGGPSTSQKVLVKLCAGACGTNEGLQMARDIKQSSSRSKQLIGELQQLKGQVYGMERQVRHLHDV
jgi:hypothetical protein